MRGKKTTDAEEATCGFCTRHEILQETEGKDIIRLEGKELVNLPFRLMRNPRYTIKYCPMCGKKI